MPFFQILLKEKRVKSSHNKGVRPLKTFGGRQGNRVEQDGVSFDLPICLEPDRSPGLPAGLMPASA